MFSLWLETHFLLPTQKENLEFPTNLTCIPELAGGVNFLIEQLDLQAPDAAGRYFLRIT
jgi:hypothetical protein